MTAEQCVNNHPTPTAAHRDAKGTCKECKRIDARNRELKRKAALAVCEGLARYGIRFESDGVPVSPEEVAQQLVQKFGNQIDN